MWKLAKMMCILLESLNCNFEVLFVSLLLGFIINFEICQQNSVCFPHNWCIFPPKIATFVIFFCTLSDGWWHAMRFIIIIIYFPTGRKVVRSPEEVAKPDAGWFWEGCILWKFWFSDWLICTMWYWVLTKQPWHHCCGVTHHCHNAPWLQLTRSVTIYFCIVFNLNNKKVNTPFACEL